jgi:sugar-specific transcriptional regulator TrmB
MSSVLQISENTKINRSQIYSDAKILIQKNFLEIGVNKRKKFIAVSPNRLESLVNLKVEKLQQQKSLLLEMEKIKNLKASKISDYEVKIYEGISQIKKAFEFELFDTKDSELFTIIGSAEYQYEMLSEEFFDDWNKKFFANKGRAKTILNKSSKDFQKIKEKLEKYNIEVRGIENFNINTNIGIWKNKVQVFALSKNSMGILIENAMISDSYKQMFAQLWSIAN